MVGKLELCIPYYTSNGEIETKPANTELVLFVSVFVRSKGLVSEDSLVSSPNLQRLSELGFSDKVRIGSSMEDTF